jgi:hypothetical protein
MTISEAQRLELYLGLQKVLGDDMANTMMNHLPPSGWGDVARVSDFNPVKMQIHGIEKQIDGLEQRIDVLDQRMDGLEHRIDLLDRRMDGLEHRMDHIEQKMNGLEVQMGKLNSSLKVLIGGVLTVSTAIIILLIQLNMNISQL